VGRDSMRDGSERALGRCQCSVEVGRRARRAGSSRARKEFEIRGHAVVEIASRCGEIRQEPSRRTPLIGQRQEHDKDDLRIADAALEGLEVASTETARYSPLGIRGNGAWTRPIPRSSFAA